MWFNTAVTNSPRVVQIAKRCAIVHIACANGHDVPRKSVHRYRVNDDETQRVPTRRCNLESGPMKKLLLAMTGMIALTGTAAAADLPARSYAKAPTINPAYDWTGFYLGLNAGGARSRSDASTSTVYSNVGYFADTSVPAIATAGNQSIGTSGFTGGLTAGYNWQAGAVVFGVESDFNYLGLKGSSRGSALYPCCAPTGFTVNSSVATDWLITLRPRLGFASNNWLFYATGGLALANVKRDFSFSDTFDTAAESASLGKTKAGWTAGVGVEYALLNGWSVKAEYLHVDLGRDTVTSANLVTTPQPWPTNVFTHSMDLTSDIVRGGLNYKFGGPVVARY
jgi:outer membrane immunogenic protein